MKEDSIVFKSFSPFGLNIRLSVKKGIMFSLEKTTTMSLELFSDAKVLLITSQILVVNALKDT